METLEGKNQLATLLSIYGGLLGKAELRRAKRHLFDDLSIAEIAQGEKTSRNAVYLSLKRAKEKLCSYEKALHLFEKGARTLSLVDRIESHAPSEDVLAEAEEIRRIWSHGI